MTGPEEADAADSGPVTSALTLAAEAPPAGAEPIAEAPRTRRRPRARAGASDAVVAEPPETAPDTALDTALDTGNGPGPGVDPAPVEAEAPKPGRSRRKAEPAVVEEPAPAVADIATDVAPAKPRRSRRKVEASAPAAEALPAPAIGLVAAEEPTMEAEPIRQDATPPANDVGDEPASDGTPRRGWWQRTFGA